jgi:hypothetical protein
MKSFLNFLSKNAPQYYSQLSKYSPGTSGFNNAWSSLASKDANGFNSVQHSFIKSSHYDPALNGIKNTTGFDASKRSAAVQNALWSTSVQHGVGGAVRVFKNAGINNKMSDAEIIKRIYQERGANNGKKYFPSSSQEIRNSVVSRFKRELQDALSMLS